MGQRTTLRTPANESPPGKYNLSFEDGQESLFINWGNQPKWKDDNQDMLARAVRVTLVPKPGEAMPLVTIVREPDDLSLDAVMVVYGTIPGRQTRLYRLQAHREGGVRTVWVYETGFVEIGTDEPSYWFPFTRENAQP